MTENQNPEQKARDRIDALLSQAGWTVQSARKIDLNAGLGQAVREYQTDVGPADYVLFVDKKPVGVIEAKREDLGHRITEVELQTAGYAAARLKWINNTQPLPFLYESTGIVTRFTDARDPKPRSREVFNFHRPETLKAWLAQDPSLRQRLQRIPPLNLEHVPASALHLRDCQEAAIANLEASFRESRSRALIQMATGAGKTYTAITAMYRLLKYADARRILFLVDTRNLGEQAEQEMMSYVPLDDNRKFTEIYATQRLKSSYIPTNSVVCISTIQRLYSILKGSELDEATEQIHPAELMQAKAPLPVVYNDKVPPEFFDFIFIDECHRSIYNLWQQVLDYFDASLIGLTATPDNRTYGFFNKNVVSEYSHEKAVADGVNVGNEVYVIETQISQNGGVIPAQVQVERREKLTRKDKADITLEEMLEQVTVNNQVIPREEIIIPIQEFLFYGRLNYNIPLFPNDIVYVPPAGTASVIGRVENPGVVFLGPSVSTITQAITERGGMRYGAESDVEVVRIGLDGESVSYYVNARAMLKRKQPDFVLQDGDQIFVYTHSFRNILEWLGNALRTSASAGASATYNPVQ